LDIDDLINENNQLKKLIEGVELYREQKLERALGEIDNIDLIMKVRDLILSDKNLSEKIIASVGKSFFEDDYMSAILLNGSIIENYRFSIVNIKEEEIPNLINNEQFLHAIAIESVMQIVSMSESYEELRYNHFTYNPLVASLYSISKILIERIDSKVDEANMLMLHQNNELFKLISIYLKEAMNSLNSTILLLSHGAYSQGLGTLRTLIEQVIIISTLANHPECLATFKIHNELKVNEEFKKNLKEIDKYLESKDINPTNMTLRSKYIDYGWLDSIEEFKTDKSKKMYRVKSMAKLIGLSEYYEWYANWSNYVHSNFLLLDIDWNHMVNIAVYQMSNLLLGMLDMYMWLTGYDFNYKSIDLNKYLQDMLKVYIEVEKVTIGNYKFVK
jgi:hypothetical protein